jgi:hypothetical protein
VKGQLQKTVICEDDSPVRGSEPSHLTVGKRYQVVNEDAQYYQIVNDEGRLTEYLKNRFRKENINEDSEDKPDGRDA